MTSPANPSRTSIQTADSTIACPDSSRHLQIARFALELVSSMRTLLSAQHGRPRAWFTERLSAAQATDIHPLDERLRTLCNAFTKNQRSSPDGSEAAFRRSHIAAPAPCRNLASPVLLLDPSALARLAGFPSSFEVPAAPYVTRPSASQHSDEGSSRCAGVSILRGGTGRALEHPCVSLPPRRR